MKARQNLEKQQKLMRHRMRRREQYRQRAGRLSPWDRMKLGVTAAEKRIEQRKVNPLQLPCPECGAEAGKPCRRDIWEQFGTCRARQAAGVLKEG